METVVAALPSFREHGYDDKFVPLTEEDCDSPPTHVAQLLDFLTTYLRRPLQGLTILDVGCGRGQLVGALRAQGVRAFGIEIDPRFVASGAVLERHHADAHPVLSTVDREGKSVFPDGYFDVVISDQVLEHVAYLSAVTAEIARVLKPGGVTCHHFPARRRLVEPHYEMPLVHWLPKNRLRLAAIRLMLALGFARRFFANLPPADRAAIIFTYSVEETFYRRIGSISRAFTAAGLHPRFRSGMKAYVQSRLKRRVPSPVPELVAQFRMVMFCAMRPLAVDAKAGG